MGRILANVPDFSEFDLVFNQDETRKIMVFFWPTLQSAVNARDMDNEMRRLAQTALIAAIDGAYALGFIFTLSQTIVRPGSGIKDLAKKLARRYMQHWWRHTRQQDLEDVKIFERIRDKVALSLKSRVNMMLDGVAQQPSTPSQARPAPQLAKA